MYNFYEDTAVILSGLPDKALGKIVKALFTSPETVKLTAQEFALYSFAKGQLDRDKEIRTKRKEARTGKDASDANDNTPASNDNTEASNDNTPASNENTEASNENTPVSNDNTEASNLPTNDQLPITQKT